MLQNSYFLTLFWCIFCFKHFCSSSQFQLFTMIEMSEFHPKTMSPFLILLISKLGSKLLFYWNWQTLVFGHKFYVFESDLCWLRRLNCLINFWSNFYSNHSEQWEVKKLSSLWKFKYWCEKSNEFCLRPYLPVCDPLFWWCFSKRKRCLFSFPLWREIALELLHLMTNFMRNSLNKEEGRN